LASYRVLVIPSVLAQLRDAPPQLQGLCVGIVAFLRVDPATVNVAFPVIAGPEFRTVVFDGGRAFLDYEVLEEYRVVILLDFVWLG
jgi:hypothetical protein